MCLAAIIISQYYCQPERKGYWEDELEMSRWRLLDSECLHMDPAHKGKLQWVHTLWPSPLKAPPPNHSCQILCTLKSLPSSGAEVTRDVVSGVYIWTQPSCISKRRFINSFEKIKKGKFGLRLRVPLYTIVIVICIVSHNQTYKLWTGP